jgi:hypothetical protein
MGTPKKMGRPKKLPDTIQVTVRVNREVIEEIDRLEDEDFELTKSLFDYSPEADNWRSRAVSIREIIDLGFPSWKQAKEAEINEQRRQDEIWKCLKSMGITPKMSKEQVDNIIHNIDNVKQMIEMYEQLEQKGLVKKKLEK